MFGKKKTEATPEPEVEKAAPEPRRGYIPKKTIPTPSRKKVSAADRQPTVTNHKAISREGRRELKRERSEANITRWNKQQETMHTDDKRNVPPQYASPTRHFDRDVADL